MFLRIYMCVYVAHNARNKTLVWEPDADNKNTRIPSNPGWDWNHASSIKVSEGLDFAFSLSHLPQNNTIYCI